MAVLEQQDPLLFRRFGLLWCTGISKLKPALALLPMVRPIAASLLLVW